ncbi:alpha/beta fold hydrolase [Amycolatopsis pigmentata]|uniref:Alpha/beta fold hydrolase n=1 Tax=Amycolatopsis pigmentata TaxID=450801 RepID=A0ABW5FU65_9PSEU
MTEVMVRVGDTELCAETFGDRSAPSILLIAGASSPMDWWDEEFCLRLAEGGRFVLRYDHRDTGRSTCSPPGEPGYSGTDLCDDVVHLIDTLADGRAHLAGLSMGGGIAQYVAIEHPKRVATLTLLSTSPGYADDLPPMADSLKATYADPVPEPDWTDREAVAKYLVELHRPLAGTHFDETSALGIARRVAERSIDPRSAKNHWLVGGDGEDLRPRLGEIVAPTLVIHGTEDRMFPAAHGQALAREIPDAELLLLERVGHEVPPRPTWDRVIPAILRHTER